MDIGVIAEKNDFGKWALYSDITEVIKGISFFSTENNNRKKMRENGFDFLHINYNSYNSFFLFLLLFIIIILLSIANNGKPFFFQLRPGKGWGNLQDCEVQNHER